MSLRALLIVFPLFGLATPLAFAETEPSRPQLEARMIDADLDTPQRMEAVCNLAAVATGESVPALIALVERDLEERHGFWACAIPILGQLADRRAVSLLIRIGSLNEEHLAGMDHMAISALSNMAGPAEVAFLESKAHVWPVRNDVLRALARIGATSSIETLISGLDDGEEPEAVAAATEGLIRIGPAALDALATAADHPSPLLAARATEIAATIRQGK